MSITQQSVESNSTLPSEVENVNFVNETENLSESTQNQKFLEQNTNPTESRQNNPLQIRS